MGDANSNASPERMAVHEEQLKEIKEQLRDFKKRLEKVEDFKEEISKLASSIDKFSLLMEQQIRTAEDQERRLDALEKADGKKWQEFVKYVGMAVLGAILAVVLQRVGL